MNNTGLVTIDLSVERFDPVAAAREFITATNDSGFFYIRYHPRYRSIIDAVREQQRKFFQLTLEAKNQIAIDLNNRGYLACGQSRMRGAVRDDLKEVFFWGRELHKDDPEVLQGVALCGPNHWPEQLPTLQSAVNEYAGFVKHYGDLLLGIVASALGAEADFFKPFYQRPMLRGQLLCYPRAPEDDVDQFGVAPHSDFGCITLLLQEVDGLEVLFPDGRWVAAPPLPDTLVVNIGDLLERWSNRRLPSTCHRVRNRTVDARYSIAMFYDPDPMASINPIDLCPRETPVYSPVSAAEYILSRNRETFGHYKELAGVTASDS